MTQDGPTSCYEQLPGPTIGYDMLAQQVDRNSGAAIASFMSAIAG